jgi:molybdopterin molybdotransferase
MKQMISVPEAKAILQENIPLGPIRMLPLNEALGLVVAVPLQSPMAVPSFDNSAMDGYAFSWDETQTHWELSDEVAAGDGNIHLLEKGKACRIFTGAPVPKGADTVIPQEWVTKEGNSITFDISQFQKGQHVRLMGAQTKVGDHILEKGQMISPGGIGLLASVGIAEVQVYAPPSVGIIITGNELKALGEPLDFGQIYNANGPVLEAYLRKLGIKEIQHYEAKDQPELIQAAIDMALATHDIVLLSGGISVGDYDYVKAGLEKASVHQLFYKIRQRPGKPLFVGMKANKIVFALPGNPSSVITCFNQYVKPSLLQWMGHSDSWQASDTIPLANPINRKSGLTFFLKAKVEKGQVNILPGQESFNLIAFGAANCFVEVPEEIEKLDIGDQVAIYYW